MSAPTSSSASARSLCLMSTPLTRATTGSDPEAAGASEELFEQPAVRGRTSSNAAMAANAFERRGGAERGSKLREVKLREVKLRVVKLREVMAWSWLERFAAKACPRA